MFKKCLLKSQRKIRCSMSAKNKISHQLIINYVLMVCFNVFHVTYLNLFC